MAPLRPGMRYPPGSTSSIPSKRTDGATQQPEDSRPPLSSTSGPRPNPSSRIPQTSVPLSSTSRQPPRLQQATHSRPPLTHQSQAWASATASLRPARPGPNALASQPPLRRMRAASPAAPAPPAAGSQRNALRQSPSQTASQDHSRERINFGKPRNISRDSSSSSIPQSHIPLSLDRGLTQSPAELHLPGRTEASSPHAATVYPELDRYRHVQPPPAAASNQSARQNPYFLFRLATEGLPPPPTPYNSGASSLGSGISGSPSTRYSESPGPGPYSRDTTPTSISSYSPSLVTSARTPAGARTRQNSRGRASSFGKEVVGDAGGLGTGASAHPLTAIRESLNSSSSSSNGTVRDGDRKNKTTKTKRLSPLPPSPPPRKSSQGFRLPSDAGSSQAKASQQERAARPELPPMPTSQARKPARVAAVSAPTALPKPASSGKSQIAMAPRPTPSSRSATHPAPPIRPSRDGAPGLPSQLGHPSPATYSNIPTALSSDRRASIGMAAASQASTAHAQRQQRPPTPLSDLSQPDQQLQSPPHPPVVNEQAKGQPFVSATSTVSESGSVSDLASNAAREPRQDPRQDDPRQKTRTPSPNVSNFRSRFPLFGRRTKAVPTQPATTTAEVKDKPPRKGPAAGTGHEGYGRLGASRRRSNSAEHLARGLTPSQESQGSTQLQDPFLRDRLSPVIISGGEVVANKNTSLDLSRTDSNASSNFQRPSLDLRNDSQVSLSSHEERNTFWPPVVSGDDRSTSTSQHKNKNRRPSDSSDSELGLIRPSLAFRRSIQRLRSPDQSQVNLATPIIIRQSPPGPSPSINSLDTGILSDDSTLDSRPGAGRGRKGSVSGSVKLAPKKLIKRARSPRKWNMFGRSHSQPASIKKGLESSSTVAVTVEAASSQEKKPVAFYTMIDSSEQEDGDMDIESVLREAHVLPGPTPTSSEEQSRRVLDSRAVSDEDLLLLPPPPLTSVMSAQQQISHRDGPPLKQSQLSFPSKPQALPEPTSPSSIPQASMTRSARPSRLQQVGRIPKVINSRQEQISPRSFSRPFNRASMASMASIQVPAAVEDTPHMSSAKDASSLEASFGANPTSDSTEFLAFPPLQNSETTSTSRSSGNLTFADSTAVVPDPCAPLFEDEIWDEYDDLFDEEGEVSKVSKVSHSVSSSQGLPFHLEGSRPLSVKTIAKQMKLEDETLESPTVAVYPQNDEAGQQFGRAPVTSSMYDFDVAAHVNETFGGNLSPPAGQLPPTPFSVSEPVSGSDAQSSGPGDVKKAAEMQRGTALSQRPGRASDGSVYSQLSEDNSPTAQVNLRVGSMTVSKWLTFGHVLFSPTRDDMVPDVSPPNGHSVLVIDGLGNDDWSFYAAETYPAATFFNMSPRAPLPAGHGNEANAFPLSPANHRQVQYLSHADKFPFSSEIFTTVVYRFPAAAPESHYRNIISESRRVLKPGGYIELSILDLDMNNMGNRTRRAVRQLKEQIHIHTPDVHLGSAADAILRLLGAKGYTDIKSCRVGVPAASAIPRSTSEAGTKDTGRTRKDDRSLAEMISDQNPVANESITNMVARVGRWWYGKCYGNAASAWSTDNDATSTTSMWTDRAILAECEEWGTNLKLMACYARVPDTKRVVSI